MTRSLRLATLSSLLLVSTPGLALAARGGTGAPRTVLNHDVVDLAELARREAAAPPALVQRCIPEPGEVEDHLEVPPEVLAAPPPPTRRLDRPPAPRATTASPPLLTDFLAIRDNGTFIPPDTHGAAGPDHLMTTLNSQVRVQDRAGAALSTVSLTAFWAGVTNPDPDPFDPKVLYDPFANRWIFVSVANAETADSMVLVAVSRTSDPTGLWNRYAFLADDPLQTSWADYPSPGFNKDWIVVDVNLFPNSGSGGLVRGDVWVFDKADLYAGGSGQNNVLSVAGAFGQTLVPAITYDAALATEYVIQAFNPDSGGQGFLRVGKITGPVGSETLDEDIGFATSPQPWAARPAGDADFAPQLGTSRKIQTNDHRMQDLVLRNGRLWTTHTIFLPPGGSPTRSAVQWWSITPEPSVVVNQRGRIDDPTGVEFHAFPSIAVNRNDDALLGYSRFSASAFAGSAYAYRFAGDTPDTFQAEALLKAGEASYDKDFGASPPENRWGDFSSTVVDPVNDTDFWTLQEFAASPANTWGTWWGQVGLATSCVALSTSDPAPALVCLGGQATFTVIPTGTAPFTYQWRRDGLDLSDGGSISGARTDTLRVDPVFGGEIGSYDVLVRDACGVRVTSGSATLDLSGAPQVSSPASVATCPGGRATFAVTVSGAGPFTFQWQKDFNDLPDAPPYSGVHADTLVVDPVGAGQAGDYAVRVIDACGTIKFSTRGTLTVVAPPQVSQPAPVTVCAGLPASFSVSVAGSGPFGYQWRKGGAPLADGGSISGATTATLTIDPTADADNGSYDVAVTDSCASLSLSSPVSLVVGGMPRLSGPIDVEACPGSPVLFSVGATGAGPFTYAWRHDGAPLADDGRITGSATASLKIDPSLAGDAGSYDVVVTDGCSGSVTSGAGQLSFGSQPPDPVGNVLRAAGQDLVGARLEWSAVNGASSYNVLRCDAGGGPCTPVVHDSTSATSDLDPDAGTFWYRLEAVNDCGTSR